MSPTEIRLVKETDMDQVIELCSLHAKFENAEYDNRGKAINLSRAIFKETPSLFCLVAERNNSIVGYATMTKEFSTWDADYYLHMDCLFILEESRGLGLGTLFIEAIKEFAIDNFCTHIQWQTPIDNYNAIGFYTSLGGFEQR